MIEITLAAHPGGAWTVTLKGSATVESRGPTASAALGKFVRGNQETLGIDWVDDPDGAPLNDEALGALVAADPAAFGIDYKAPDSPRPTP